MLNHEHNLRVPKYKSSTADWTCCSWQCCPLWSQRVILPLTQDRSLLGVEDLSALAVSHCLPPASLHPFLPSCLCFFLSISLPHFFLFVFGQFIPFLFLFSCSLHLFFCCNQAPFFLPSCSAIRFQFHLDSPLKFISPPLFIPAALPLRYAIHEFSNNRPTTQRRNPISLLSVLCRGCDI